MRAFFARLGGPSGSGHAKGKDGKARSAVREKIRDEQGEGAGAPRAVASSVDVPLPAQVVASAASPASRQPTLLPPLSLLDSIPLSSALDASQLEAVSSERSSLLLRAAPLPPQSPPPEATTGPLETSSSISGLAPRPDPTDRHETKATSASSVRPAESGANVAAGLGLLSSTAGESRKVEKTVVFTTPASPEPALALTGEPIITRLPPVSEEGRTLTVSLAAGSPALPTTTTTGGRSKLEPTAGRTRASSARPADTISKGPSATTLRIKKGSTPTHAGVSSSTLQAVASRSSSYIAPPPTTRSLSAQTTSSQAARLRRPELSRPLSAMSDSSALTGTTGGGGGSSYIGSHSNWSQWADEDLLMNLGPRERTRQEVLWEIVSSEERYVVDLQGLVSTFISSLLPPPPVGSPTLDEWTPPLGTISSATSATWSSPGSSATADASPKSAARNVSAESSDLLPIAARFQQSTFLGRHDSGRSSDGGSGAGSPAPAFGTHEFDSFAMTSAKPFLYDTLHRPHPLGQLKPIDVPFPDGPSPTSGGDRRAAPTLHSHQSLPPSTRASLRPASSYHPEPQRRLVSADAAWNVSKHKPLPASPPAPPVGAARPGAAAFTAQADVLGLPEDFRVLLEVLRDGILPGHLALSRALRARHAEQFPLVRSLADVFNAHSYVLREYNTYVLHLSDALGMVDAALTSDAGLVGKKAARKVVENGEVVRLRKVFQELDELAADKGESGLAISLSKPFQRLLKYPLLLQNLLFHTDPSTKEYEATLGMVEDVEAIIRSIEDEKTAVDDRIRTRDAFARIDGLDREKMLMAPAPSRLLQEEFPTGPDGARLTAPAAARRQLPMKAKEKKVSRRLSEMLKPTAGAPSDLWIVCFSDVSLLCQRTGTTTLPLAATTTRSASLPDLHGKAKFATVSGRRTQQQPRNLYKLVRIFEWAAPVDQSPSNQRWNDETTIGRATGQTRRPLATPDEPVVDEDAELDSDDSFDAKSRMSFNYQAGDVVEPAPPLPTGRATAASARRAGAASSLSQASKVGTTATTDAARRSSGQEKFGSRLRSPEPPVAPTGARVSSRARAAAPSSTTKRALTPAARPAWNSNVTAAPIKPRTPSATQLKLAGPVSAAKKSPTPSEDIASLYRSSRKAA